ncbi:sugar phosphate isomerase/epimerase [Paracoccus liaowanqingii]|uniref:Sugar phosphate isomerase/epimerase n=1 Tax=Paracoccus liaowanqingii TaxID=2560053 RepID=A0A4Z1CI58_9RHOB|nr:sugar phosphate isomerase/epimerase family protein [Paracoccus liaowanqingii]TGN62187.1 sugar phosphate isomerase/epimerase [Paracoccus liaowanqingii]
MKLGLGSYAFRWNIGIGDQHPPHPMTAFDLLDEAHSRGLTVVQYADNLPLDRLSDDERHRLARIAADRGMTLELGTQSFDADQVARYLVIGQRIGARILRVALDEADARMPVADLARQLRPLLQDARDAGIRIAIENHFNYPSPRMVELLETVDDPQLGVCLDVANSICAGEWTEETVGLLAPWTINLHLKDYVITPDPHGVGFRIQGVPLGQGRAPLDWVLAQLGHCPPETSCILEHWLPLGGDPQAARAQERPWLDQTVAHARRIVT